MTVDEAKLVLDNARPQTKEIDRQFYDDEDLNNALDMAIKALEIVEEFEKAQIVTGGRLNGRTYAYKCGLEDGKRKALEQPTFDNCVSRQAVKEGMIKYGFRAPDMTVTEFIEDELPPVTPTHGTCKDCKYNVKDKRTTTMCDIGHRFFMRIPDTFYCADFEKRGNKDGSN